MKVEIGPFPHVWGIPQNLFSYDFLQFYDSFLVQDADLMLLLVRFKVVLGNIE